MIGARRGSIAAAVAWLLIVVSCGDVSIDLVIKGDPLVDASVPFRDASIPDAGVDRVGDEAAFDAPPDEAGDSASTSIACTGNADCPSSASLCDPTAHLCVQCLTDGDCGGNTPHCNPTTRACFSCVVDTDCDPTMACNKAIPRCASKCTNGTECNGTPCDIAYGYCVQCLHDSDCTSPDKRCLLPQRYCVQCLSNTDCPGSTCASTGKCL